MQSTDKETRPFVVMAKPVGSRCNMRCAYCYYLEKSEMSSSEKQTRMSFSLLERLIRQTEEDCPGDTVSFVWHGGEPTLAGLDFFRKAVELEKKHLPRGKRVWNNLQTNGLMINEAWCRFLKENGFDVGVSIDGSEAVHDHNRRSLGGEATYARVRRSIELLRKNGVEPDLLCTVNSYSSSRPLEVYRALRDTGCTWLQFIPVSPRAPDAPYAVKPEDYGEFLCAVFDEWAAHDIGKLDIQLVAETARILAGGEASVCYLNGECGFAVVAEEDGAVYSCDHFVDGPHRLGNVKSARLGPMVSGAFQTAFGRSKKEKLTAECRGCEYLFICGGGCLKDRFGKSAGGEEGHYYLCAGMKRFFAHALPVLRRIMELSASGTKPDEIMHKLKQREET